MDSIDKINAILYAKGMSGADLERAIEVSNSVYSQWNKKITKPSKKSLKKVADVLGVDVSELRADSDEKEKSSTPESAELGVSDDDLKHLAAFHAADEDTKKAIRLLLAKFQREEGEK